MVAFVRLAGGVGCGLLAGGLAAVFWQAGWLRSSGKRVGCSRRASEASPGVSTALGGYDAVAPLPKRCREERSDDRVIRLVAPGKAGWPAVLLVFGSAAVPGSEPLGRARARWRRSRSSGADVRRVDERSAESLAAVDERCAPSTDRGAARAVPARHGTRPTGSALTARRVGPTQRPGGRQANPSCQLDEPYNAVVASLLPAPLRKRRARRHTRPSVGADVGARFARGGRGPAQGPAPARACQEDGSPSRSTRGSPARGSGARYRRDVSEDGRPPGRRVRSPLRASGSATPLVQLAGGPAAPGARAKRAPASAPPLRRV